jgi:hypothetical protein
LMKVKEDLDTVLTDPNMIWARLNKTNGLSKLTTPALKAIAFSSSLHVVREVK